MEEVIDLVFEDSDDDEEEPAIFRDIDHNDLPAVQQRVLADGAVLEERARVIRITPLIHAVYHRKANIALWLIEHRGQHDLNTADVDGWTALHWASSRTHPPVVQALVAAGANLAALTNWGGTPLMLASRLGRTEIVAFLLRLPAVKASIDHISQYQETALSLASSDGHQPLVQLLLGAGADPTIPPGPDSALNRALSNNRHTVVALLRHTISEADRARALHKARSLLSAGAAALACLQGRLEQGKALPRVELTAPQQQQQQQQQQQPGNERFRATAAFAVGVSSGEKDTGLNEELYVELQKYLLPGAWADKGPAGV